MEKEKKRLVFIVEGDTEIAFIHKYVIPYLYNKGFSNIMYAQTMTTNKKLNTKGGNVGFKYLKNNVKRVAAQNNVLITTMIDFFKLPSDYPNYSTDRSRIQSIESGIRDDVDVDASIFLPYIQQYEIESLMFTSMDGFNFIEDDANKLKELQKIIGIYSNPEEINGGVETAPSKRLQKIISYDKIADGELIFSKLRIDDIRARCPRFDEWIAKLEEGLKNDRF